MRHRSNVSPAPLPVERGEDGVTVEYHDGRRVRYAGPIEVAEERVSATTSFEIHVLVADPAFTEGIVVYINDYDTRDDILDATGVGRVLLADGAVEAIYPGVRAGRSGETIEVSVDPDLSDAWVYVFVENQLNERAYCLVTPKGAVEDHCR